MVVDPLLFYWNIPMAHFFQAVDAADAWLGPERFKFWWVDFKGFRHQERFIWFNFPWFHMVHSLEFRHLPSKKVIYEQSWGEKPSMFASGQQHMRWIVWTKLTPSTRLPWAPQRNDLAKWNSFRNGQFMPCLSQTELILRWCWHSDRLKGADQVLSGDLWGNSRPSMRKTGHASAFQFVNCCVRSTGPVPAHEKKTTSLEDIKHQRNIYWSSKSIHGPTPGEITAAFNLKWPHNKRFGWRENAQEPPTFDGICFCKLSLNPIIQSRFNKLVHKPTYIINISINLSLIDLTIYIYI